MGLLPPSPLHSAPNIIAPAIGGGVLVLVLRGLLPGIWYFAFVFEYLTSRAPTGRRIHSTNHHRKYISRIAFRFDEVFGMV